MGDDEQIDEPLVNWWWQPDRSKVGKQPADSGGAVLNWQNDHGFVGCCSDSDALTGVG